MVRYTADLTKQLGLGDMIKISSILDAERYLQNVDAVIFDLDDTLYSEKEYVKSGFEKIASRFEDSKTVFDELWQAFLNKQNAIDIIAEKYKVSNKEELLFLYRFQNPNIHLYDGVLDMIGRIKLTKRLGLITDGRPEGQNAKIDALGIRELFDKIIITDELGGIEFRKPNKMAFELMSECLNTDFNRMVYIGDNINKDFIAPLSLGMSSIHFINSDGLYT